MGLIFVPVNIVHFLFKVSAVMNNGSSLKINMDYQSLSHKTMNMIKELQLTQLPNEFDASFLNISIVNERWNDLIEAAESLDSIDADRYKFELTEII